MGGSRKRGAVHLIAWQLVGEGRAKNVLHIAVRQLVKGNWEWVLGTLVRINLIARGGGVEGADHFGVRSLSLLSKSIGVGPT